MVLTLERDGELIQVQVKPELDAAGEYKIGAWGRDNAQGVGTMTYIDNQGNFGALGHGINDVDTSTLMHMEDGTLYQKGRYGRSRRNDGNDYLFGRQDFGGYNL